MKAGTFAMLCHAAVVCKTLAQALERSLRFYALILDDISGSCVRDVREARIVLHERLPGASQRVFAHELLLMLLYGVSCWLVGRRIPLLEARFRCAEPPTANPDKYGEELLDAYVFVEDADALYAEYAARGVEFTRGLADTPWGSRGFVVKDCDGRLLAFGSNL